MSGSFVKKIFTLLLLSLSFQVFSIDFREKVQEAILFYEGGSYEKAAEILNECCAACPSPKDKKALLYNLGTVYLGEKKWAEAEEAFASCVDGVENPELLRATYLNWASLKLREVQEALSNTKDEELTLPLIQSWKANLTSGEEKLSLAKEADDRWKLLKELSDESSLSSIEENAHAIRHTFLRLHQLEEELKLSQAAFSDLLSNLVQGLSQQVDLLGTWERGDETQKKQSGPFFTQLRNLQQERGELWERLYEEQKKLEEEEGQSLASQFARQWLSQAQDAKLRAGDFLRGKSSTEAAESLSRARSLLIRASAVNGSGDPVGVLVDERIRLGEEILRYSRPQNKEAKVQHDGELLEAIEKAVSQIKDLCLEGILLQGQADVDEKARAQLEVEAKMEAELWGLFFQGLQAYQDPPESHLEAVTQNKQFLSLKKQEEATLLANLYRSLLKSENQNKSSVKASQDSTLDHLQKRFYIRSKLEIGKRKGAAEKTLAALDGAAEGRVSQLEGLEGALLFWAPTNLLGLKLHEILESSQSLDILSESCPQNLQAILGKRENINQILEIIRLNGEAPLQVEKVQPFVNHFFDESSTSLGRLNDSKVLSAGLYQKDGIQWLKRAIQNLEPSEEQSLAGILEQGIGEEKHSIFLTEGLLQFPTDLEPEKALVHLNHLAQDYALECVAPFEEVAEKNPEGIDEETILKAAALVSEGTEVLQEALGALGTENCDLKNTLVLENRGLTLWEEAYALLQKPPKGENGEPPPPDDGGDGSGEGESPPPPAPEENKEGNDGDQGASDLMGEVVPLLLQMEEEDRPPQQVKAPPRKGLRPW